MVLLTLIFVRPKVTNILIKISKYLYLPQLSLGVTKLLILRDKAIRTTVEEALPPHALLSRWGVT
jgi:hypothetical protein